MKKQLLFLALSFIMKFSVGQIVCVQCFDQNDSVYAGGINLIQNGGFENTTCGFNSSFHSFCPGSQTYNCDITNWTCTGGGGYTYAYFWDSTHWYVDKGMRSPYFGNNFCWACSTITDYDTSCLNTSGCRATGIPVGYPLNTINYGGTEGVSLSQTISGLVPGHIYLLEFWAGGEADSTDGFTGKGLFAVNVGFGNTFLRNKPTHAHTGIGTRFIIEFKPSTSIDTIKFTNWGHICDSCSELVLDDVRLYHYNPVVDPPIPCSEAGINNPTENQITIYPNPATSELTVTTGNNEASQIIIYDVTSRKIMEQKFIGTSTLTIETLAKGVYIYEVRNGKEAVKGKVVKE